MQPKRFLLISIILSLLFSVLPPHNSHAADWYDSNWSYRQKITILPALTDSNLTDFPYLVKITDAANPLFANAQADHDDILFTKSDGLTKLDHEIEYYESTAGNEELVAWVRVEALSSTVNTEIYIYYGYALAGNQENVPGVWSNGYESVYHLHDDFNDSLAAHNGSNSGSSDVVGQIADAQDFFPGDGNDEIGLGSWSVSGSQLTIEAWIKCDDSFAEDDPRVISKAQSSAEQDHIYMMSLYNGTINENRLRFRLKTGTVDTSGTTTFFGTSPNGYLPDTNQWYHVAMTYDGAQMRIIRDGLDAGSIAKTGALRENAWPVSIGNIPASSETFGAWDGKIDEVRISKIAREPEWIAASYRNQNSPDTYQSLSLEEQAPDISIDCDFSSWTDGGGTEFVVDDEGGPDDWSSPAKYDITRFGVASNLSDTFYLLFGFDDLNPNNTTAAVLIDTDLDDNINFALVATLTGAESTVELFTCDNSIPYGCGNQTFSKTYTTPQDYCVGSGAGPWNNDTFVEVAVPYSDLGSFTGGTSILTALTSYTKDDLEKPKDSIFADYYDRIEYDADTGTGQTIDDAGTPVISGTVFSDEGTTPVGIGKTVRLLVNGAVLGTDTTDSDGYYFIVAPVGANDDILVYIDDDATYQGTTVTVFDGVRLNDLDIYAGHVITRHDNGGSLSNAHMFSAKGGATDSDILYAVPGGTDLNVTGTGTELYVPTGYSFVPGGDVTTPNMENLGTFTGGTGAIDINGTLTLSGGGFTSTNGNMSIAGNFVHAGGTFSHNGGTVTLDGTGQSISGSTGFNNLTKTVASADTLTFEAGATQTIAGTGTVSLKGADGNLLSLVSGTPDTRWNFTLTAGAAKDISYVNVKDSDASGSDATLKPINPANSMNSGNTIDWFPILPDIILLKSVQTFSDPYNGETNPKAIPGGVMLYTIIATNQGAAATDADTVFITDPIPANTALFVGDIDGPGPAAGPVLFTDGTPPDDSGLNYTFTSLDNLTDDVAFSNDGGTTYNYIPVPDGDGFDTNVTHMRINPKGTFKAASGGDIPTFEVKFKVRVE